MQRDVYSKLITKLKDLQEFITEMGSDVTGIEEDITAIEEDITAIETSLSTKSTITTYTGTVPAEGGCKVEVGSFATMMGWQFLVETSSGVWSDTNTVTYFTSVDNSVNLYLVGDSASYRGKNYKLFVYSIPAEVSGT